MGKRRREALLGSHRVQVWTDREAGGNGHGEERTQPIDMAVDSAGLANQ